MHCQHDIVTRGNTSRVPDQNGVSLLYIKLEIHHSGREPLICYNLSESIWGRTVLSPVSSNEFSVPVFCSAAVWLPYNLLCCLPTGSTVCSAEQHHRDQSGRQQIHHAAQTTHCRQSCYYWYGYLIGPVEFFTVIYSSLLLSYLFIYFIYLFIHLLILSLFFSGGWGVGRRGDGGGVGLTKYGGKKRRWGWGWPDKVWWEEEEMGVGLAWQSMVGRRGDGGGVGLTKYEETPIEIWIT